MHYLLHEISSKPYKNPVEFYNDMSYCKELCGDLLSKALILVMFNENNPETDALDYKFYMRSCSYGLHF